jgi:3-oxoadipate enol-lactonase
MPQAAVNGTDIYYELHGSADAEVLVLVNGILMSTASWPYQVPVLSKRYRLLLHDCRGQWQSAGGASPAGPYTMELHADDLAALLDALHIERAHIGGISPRFTDCYNQDEKQVVTGEAVLMVLRP